MLFQAERKVINHPELKYGDASSRLDFTEHSVRAIIPASVWEVVVSSAYALQDNLPLPFEPGDVVMHPAHDCFFEVEQVIDQTHRMPPNMGRFVQGRSRIEGPQVFRACDLIQASCVMEAYEPYNDNLHIIQADTGEEANARLAIVLANLGILE